MLAALACLASLTASPQLDVRVDPRIELLTIVYRLAEAGEFSQPSSESPYSKRVDAYFAKYKTHPAVLAAAKVREEDGISFNAVTNLAVHLKDTKSLGELVPFEPVPGRWDPRWKPAVARAFVKELKRFVEDTRFNDFVASESTFYKKAVGGMRKLVAKYPVDRWLPPFYGVAPKKKPFAIVGLLCGGGNYGMSVEFPDKSLLMCPVLGAHSFDPEGIPQYDVSSVATVVHEFSHAYVNDLVEPYVPRLKPIIEKYTPTLADVWWAGAYEGAATIAYESFVRGVESYMVRKHLPAKDALEVLIDQRSSGFLWTSDLDEALDQYASNRAKFKTLRDFLPVWIEVFEKAAREPEQLYGRCPKVTGVETEFGELDADHQSVKVTVRFDQPMMTDKRGFNMEPAGYEVIEKTHYAADSLSLSLTLKIQKGTEYTVHLNRFGRGYVSETGYPVLPVTRPLRAAGR